MLNELLSVISEMAQRIPVDVLMALADEIDLLESMEDIDQIRPFFNPNMRSLRDQFLDACECSGVTTKQVAAFLRGACTMADSFYNKTSVELVWTGPKTDYVPIRSTEQVLIELIRSTQHKVFIVSFVANNFGNVLRALKEAINRGVEVNMLLELSKEQGGRQLQTDSLGLVKQNLPETNLYKWDQPEMRGVVHAKCAVADRNTLFLTSANLTHAAMDFNMEAGILIKGGDIPGQLANHLQALIDTRVVVPYTT